MAESTRCSRCGSALSQEQADRHFAGMCPNCLANAALQDTRPDTASPPTRIQTMIPPLKEGAVFHGLEILDILGFGGMGMVYRARQTSLNRTVALKVLAPQLAQSEEFAQRFDREAKILASLNHPNIVHVYDFGKENDLLYLAMEHVDGANLESLLGQKPPPDLVSFLTLMRSVARGLQRVHEAGLVHRDIKPANILVAKDGTPKIGDFGLAIETQAAMKLTESGMFVGTPHYVSPEHVQGKKVDARSDLYSLGIILYQGIAGRTPFHGSSATAILMKHVQDAPPPLYKFAPHAPAILGEITRKLLAKNPASRHESAVALEKDLERAIEAVKAGPATPSSIKTRPAPRPELAPAPPPWKWIAMGAAAVVGIILILVALFHDGPEKVQEPPVEVRQATTARPKPPPPPLPAPPVEETKQEPVVPAPPPPDPKVQLSQQDKRRELDHGVQIINLCGITALYCDLKGKTAEAAQLRTTMAVTQDKLKRLLDSLRAEGQNPFVDDTLLSGDALVYFDDVKVETASKERMASLYGTFAARIKAGSRARVVVQRDAAPKEFVIRFDERPKDLLSILQVAGLIPGEAVEESAEPTVKAPENKSEPKPPAPVKPPEEAPPPPPRPAAPVPAMTSRKAAFPDAATQRDMEKSVRDTFKSEYAKKTPADQAALAETLLDQGKVASTDLAGRYILLREARDIATQVGQVETAVRAVAVMAELFDFDGIAAKAAVLSKAASQVKGPEGMVRYSRAFLALGEEAQSAGTLEPMQPLTSKADAAARGSGDAGLLTQVQTLNKDLVWAAQQASLLKPHQKTLLDKPDDPAANLVVGRFVCLVQNDWTRGSLMLLKSSDALLRAAAEKELEAPKEAAAQVLVGDAWWNAGEKEPQPETKRRLIKRSFYWYLQAVPGLNGLSRQRAENRLRMNATVSLPGVPSGAPTALVGGSGGGPFEDLPKPTALVVGFRMAWEGSPAVMTMVQASYSTNAATSTQGKPHGGGSQLIQETLAKPGYAVGGVVLRGRTRVNGIKVIYMRVAGPVLDPRDTYESEWFGDAGPDAVTLGRTGSYVIGICGTDGTQVDSLGIILLKR